MTTEIAPHASTGAPADFPVAQNIPYGGYLAGGMGLVVTVIGTILAIRRRISRDNTALKHDATERDILQSMTNERNRAQAAAEEAWRTRAEDAKLIGQLTGEVKHLTEANQNLILDVATMRQEIKELRETVAMLLPAMSGIHVDSADLHAYITARREAAQQAGG